MVNLLRLPTWILISFIAPLCIGAQDRPLEFGLMGGLGLGTHDAAFSKLGSFPSCCPEFTGGSGTGAVIGGYAAFSLSDGVRIHTRLLSSSEPATMTDDERTVVADLRNGASVVDALFRHELNASIATIGLEPLIAWQPAGSLELMIGPRLAFTTTASFTQRETLVEPSDYGAYLGDDRVWVDNSGLIPNAQSVRLGVVLAARYSLPMNADSTLLLVPEASYVYDVTGVAAGVSWKSHQLRLMAGIGWRPRREQEPIIEPAPPSKDEEVPIVEVPVDRKPPLAGSIRAVAVQANGGEEALVEMKVEETVAKELRPLLPYVYFSAGDARIPDRYRRRTKEEALRFREDQLYADSTLGIYHDLLNVIGRRLQSRPSASLTLTGTVSSTPQDNGQDLARRRAEAVRDYLVSSWGIPASRLTIVARGTLPELPTRANDPADVELAHEENRRVEISCSDPSVLEPVLTTDTLRVSNPPSVRFWTENLTASRLMSWKVEARQAGVGLYSASGTGVLPKAHLWNIMENRATIPLAEEPIEYQLTLEDDRGSVFVSPPLSIPVRQLTISRKKIEQVGDREIERFSLILFDFNESAVKGQNASIVSIIASRTQNATSVTIAGSTDVIGSEAYNGQLARSRATETAKALGLTGTARIVSTGEQGPYTMSLPEGRAYSRTVVVTVETPITRR
ncbi:MAG: hypothetical protein MUC47_02175 [Candidatus Kapabacteria bacterium]|nr:hypothetical protein [Candidatus Kapabacteria bacterium]